MMNDNENISHVNLMLDTLLANVPGNDLRTITRSLLTTNPDITPAFLTASRTHLREKRNPSSLPLFSKKTDNDAVTPTPHLDHVLRRIRTLYGAGMGIDSLGILASVVRATIGIQWQEDGEMAGALAAIDTDISQAIQSWKEEQEAGFVEDPAAAHEVIRELRSAVSASSTDVLSWDGEFPFERAMYELEFLED